MDLVSAVNERLVESYPKNGRCPVAADRYAPQALVFFERCLPGTLPVQPWFNGSTVLTSILIPQLVRKSLQQLQESIWPASPTSPRPDARESLDGCFFVAEMLLRSWGYLHESR